MHISHPFVLVEEGGFARLYFNVRRPRNLMQQKPFYAPLRAFARYRRKNTNTRGIIDRWRLQTVFMYVNISLTHKAENGI
jgi:hypothetical protein